MKLTPNAEKTSRTTGGIDCASTAYLSQTLYAEMQRPQANP